jgi:Ala-tRNA(Pro) deacylase
MKETPMVNQRLMDFLDAQRAKYLAIQHNAAGTANALAETTHTHGWEIAKTLILKADGKFVMAVLPANEHVDFRRFGQMIRAKNVALATESELSRIFPDCEIGAMPPFGHLWRLPVFVDARLSEDMSIVFHAGTHKDALQMDFADYERLAEPVIVDFRSRDFS